MLLAWQREAAQLAREQALLAQQRAFIPRIEYDVECRFLGPQGADYVTEVRLLVSNKSLTRRAFSSIRIRLLIIPSKATLEFWPEGNGRLLFRRERPDVDLVPQDGGRYYFIEPGVRQVFTYVTKVPADVTFVLLHAKFTSMVEPSLGESPYENQFVEERVFATPSAPPGGQDSQGAYVARRIAKE
jgi:hypothetical protein